MEGVDRRPVAAKRTHMAFTSPTCSPATFPSSPPRAGEFRA